MTIGSADGSTYETAMEHYLAFQPASPKAKEPLDAIGLEGSNSMGSLHAEVAKHLVDREDEFYQSIESGREIGNFLKDINLPLPKESDPGSENIEDRRAPIYSRSRTHQPEGDWSTQPAIPIMRHGETIENKDDTAHGWSNEPLIKEGREQVEKSANELKSNPPTLIAHSDLKRAAESAKIVADKTGAETLAIPELRTWDIGNFAGMKCGECEKELKPYVDNPDKRVPGGESFNDFRRRVQEGWGKAMSAGADMLVTHNKTERMIAAMETGKPPHEEFTHTGGPEPGKIRLAGDILPGPSIWNTPPRALSTMAGNRGRASINNFLDQGYFKGSQYEPKLGNVENIEGPVGKGKLTEEQKYDVAVQRQQQSRQQRDLQERADRIRNELKNDPELQKYMNSPEYKKLWKNVEVKTIPLERGGVGPHSEEPLE